MKLAIFGENEQQAAHLKLGSDAEKIAEIFLQQKGLILVKRNFRCKHGEIDLIMRDGKALVFIEVRLRSHGGYVGYGGAAMSINHAKQHKLTCTAEFYLQVNGSAECRFDAILMQSADINAVEWIKNAF